MPHSADSSETFQGCSSNNLVEGLTKFNTRPTDQSLITTKDKRKVATMEDSLEQIKDKSNDEKSEPSDKVKTGKSSTSSSASSSQQSSSVIQTEMIKKMLQCYSRKENVAIALGILNHYNAVCGDLKQSEISAVTSDVSHSEEHCKTTVELKVTGVSKSESERNKHFIEQINSLSSKIVDLQQISENCKYLYQHIVKENCKIMSAIQTVYQELQETPRLPNPFWSIIFSRQKLEANTAFNTVQKISAYIKLLHEDQVNQEAAIKSKTEENQKLQLELADANKTILDWEKTFEQKRKKQIQIRQEQDQKLEKLKKSCGVAEIQHQKKMKDASHLWEQQQQEYEAKLELQGKTVKNLEDAKNNLLKENTVLKQSLDQNRVELENVLVKYKGIELQFVNEFEISERLRSDLVNIKKAKTEEHQKLQLELGDANKTIMDWEKTFEQKREKDIKIIQEQDQKLEKLKKSCEVAEFQHQKKMIYVNHLREQQKQEYEAKLELQSKTVKNLEDAKNNLLKENTVLKQSLDQSRVELHNAFVKFKGIEWQLDNEFEISKGLRSGLVNIKNAICKQDTTLATEKENFSKSLNKISTKILNYTSQISLEDVKRQTESKVIEQALNRIRDIQEDVRKCEHEISSFQGNSSDKAYLNIKGMLTRAMGQLDTIESQKKKEIQFHRKEAIDYVKYLQGQLERSLSTRQ